MKTLVLCFIQVLSTQSTQPLMPVLDILKDRIETQLKDSETDVLWKKKMDPQCNNMIEYEYLDESILFTLKNKNFIEYRYEDILEGKSLSELKNQKEYTKQYLSQFKIKKKKKLSTLSKSLLIGLPIVAAITYALIPQKKSSSSNSKAIKSPTTPLQVKKSPRSRIRNKP